MPDRPPTVSVDLRRALPATMTVSHWIAADGWSIRRFDWPADPAVATRGMLFFQGGRGDIFEKYLESFGHWHDRGWSLAGFDWRGHGGSGRFDHAAGRSSEFAPAVADLAAIWSDRVGAASGPRVLIGHSMGGYLGLRALLDRSIAPDAFVAVAPMWGVRTPLGPALTERIARWQCRRGDPGRPLWSQARHEASRIDRMGMLTHDADRYADGAWWHERMPEHRLGSPSWAWLHEALESTRLLRADPRLDRIATPVLVLMAEQDRLVEAGAIREVAARMPCGELVAFGPESAHEILRERDAVRDRALAAIDAFLDRVAVRR